MSQPRAPSSDNAARDTAARDSPAQDSPAQDTDNFEDTTEPQNGDAIIQFSEVSRWYGQVLGLNKVTCDIGPGITGLLGPNGAGKSTFLKLVTGLLKPSSGSLKVLSRRVWDNPDLMSRVGYCPEIDNFYETMTGHEFVSFMTRLHGYELTESKERAAGALDKVGLSKRDGGRRIRAYSKGMRQKTKLAQAIAHDPELLVLDEPFTGADPVSRHQMIELLRHQCEEGVHALISSHVLHEIEELTKTMLLIDHGRVLAEGSVRDIRDLIDEHPHRIVIVCTDPREMAARLIATSYVNSVRVTASGLEVNSHEPAACYRRIPQIAARANVVIHSLESFDNNMEAVFRYLVEGRPMVQGGPA